MRLAVIDNNGNVINVIQGDNNSSINGFTLKETNFANIGDKFTFSNNDWHYIENINQISIDDKKKELIEKLADKLNDFENSGIFYKNHYFKTDSSAQLKFLGVALSILMDSNYSVNFKTIEGEYIDLNATEAMELCLKVKNYVQSCYTNEGFLLDQIKSASNLDDLNNIDISNGWPLNI